MQQKLTFPKTQKKVLLVSTDYHLGDFCMTLPAIEHFAQYFDDGVDVIVFEPFARLVELLPSSHKIRIIEYSAGRKKRDMSQHLNFLKLLFGVFAHRYSVSIGLTIRVKDSMLSLFSFARYRVGHAIAPRSWSFNRRLEAPKQKHVRFIYRKSLETIGLSEAEVELPEFRLPSELMQRAGELVKTAAGNSGYVVIHPLSGKGYKNWPREKYIQVADKIMAELGLGVVFIGSKDEKEKLEGFRSELQKNENAVVITESIDASIAVIKLAKLIVCNMSGPSHLAAITTETPLVSIAGPTPIEEWQPVRDEKHIALSRETCDPCLQRQCQKNFQCWDTTVDEVFDAATSLLQK